MTLRPFLALRRLGARVLARLRRIGRGLRRLVRDRTARPVLGYLLAMALAVASVAVFLLGGAGRPRTPETALLLSSLGMVMLTALSLGGSRPRRE